MPSSAGDSEDPFNRNLGRQFDWDDLPVAGSFELSAHDIAAYREIADAARMHHDMSEHMRTAPTDLSDMESLKSHLIFAHGVPPDFFFKDEAMLKIHPRMSPVDWDEVDRLGQYPWMDHHDLRVLHEDDHVEFEEPHTMMDDQHFHH